MLFDEYRYFDVYEFTERAICDTGTTEVFNYLLPNDELVNECYICCEKSSSSGKIRKTDSRFLTKKCYFKSNGNVPLHERIEETELWHVLNN